MDHFSLIDGAMHAEGVPLATIADAVGTPVYVYSTATFERHARVFREGLAGAGRVHLAYAIKANPNDAETHRGLSHVYCLSARNFVVPLRKPKLANI